MLPGFIVGLFCKAVFVMWPPPALICFFPAAMPMKCMSFPNFTAAEATLQGKLHKLDQSYMSL